MGAPDSTTERSGRATSEWTPALTDDPVDVSLRKAGLDPRPIPRLDGATPDDLRRAITGRSGPMVFSGLIDGWRASQAWTPEKLAATHGTKVVTALMDLPSTGTLFPQDQRHYERELTFAAFIDAMLTASPDSPCYLAYRRASEIFEPADYDFLDLVGGDGRGSDTRVWIGSAGTRSMLHSDLKDNLFCQIWGHKHVVLLPWEESRAAYPYPDNIVNSRIDLEDIDLARFPRLRKAVMYSATVGPGEIVYIPRGCWHDFRARTASVSINHWFGPPMRFRDYAGLLATLGPAHWGATARDFVRHGILDRREETRFFFSPPSTGRRLYNALRYGDFSRENDPTTD